MLDLQTDRALSDGQLRRHYGLDTSQLGKPFLHCKAFCAPTYGSQAYARVTFVTLERKVTRLGAASLRHLAGAAEMRRLLGAPREAWRSDAQARSAVEVPDALWFTPQGEIAIEYDAGSYSTKRISAKAFAYRRYAGQVWGSPSRKHVAHLTRLLQAVGEKMPPLYALWR